MTNAQHHEAARRRRLEASPSVLAYADRRSVRAGESVTFSVSSTGGADFDAQVVRLLAPDVGPVGPPMRTQAVSANVNGQHPGVEQPIRPGSHVRIDRAISVGDLLDLEVLVEPTLITDAPCTIVEARCTSGTRVTVDHSAVTGLRLTVSGSGGARSLAAAPLTSRRWHRVHVSVDGTQGAATVGWRAVVHHGLGAADGDEAEAALPPLALDEALMTFAVSLDGDGVHHDPTTSFNGKLEAPSLRRRDGTVIAAWDFARDMSSSDVVDIGTGEFHGRIVNFPTRATRGASWNSRRLSWTEDPSAYAAIHFHDDDVADAGWQPTFTLDVPADTTSGCYALRVAPSDDATPEFWVPYFVRPAAGAKTADIAFIVPTTTYAAYANMHLRVTAQFNELAHGRLTVLDSTDLLLLRRPELGRSTYDVHGDGSPVVYSSMNRPVTNFRPTGRMYKFCLDLMIVDWLDARGYDFDVITDDEIDCEGASALSPYRTILTGSHPEYITARQRDAMEEHLRTGARLVYLGGNGFYAAAEVVPGHPDAVEVRRPGQDNLWRVDHTEGATSSSGSPSGLWRNIGRPENALTGVGFITQGFDACTFYRRSDESQDPRVAWIFNGLAPDAVIGDFGILQGGAAGYEIDRHDPTKGSPPHSLVIASSGGHSNLYDLMVPSILDTLPDPSSPRDAIRADMVFFETGHGGAVFSVGSIAWTGSLSHNGYDNSVSTVTANVLDRFNDPRPFLLAHE